MRRQLFAAAAAAVAAGLFAPAAQAGPVDLSNWTVVQYQFPSQGNANWVRSNNNTVATQTVNADASILLSDFDVANTEINGKWAVNTASDNDFMGFVFGYQGRGSYYLFDWKQADQNDPLGFAERGMSIKKVQVPNNADPTGNDLWPTAGSSRVTNLYHNTIPWAEFTVYDFRLVFRPGQFTVEVRQGANLLMSQTINDATYQSGQFGFYNYSQGGVRYEAFTLDPAPPVPTAVPAPAGVVLGLAGAIGILGDRLARRRRRGV